MIFPVAAAFLHLGEAHLAESWNYGIPGAGRDPQGIGNPAPSQTPQHLHPRPGSAVQALSKALEEQLEKGFVGTQGIPSPAVLLPPGKGGSSGTFPGNQGTRAEPLPALLGTLAVPGWWLVTCPSAGLSPLQEGW